MNQLHRQKSITKYRIRFYVKGSLKYRKLHNQNNNENKSNAGEVSLLGVGSWPDLRTFGRSTFSLQFQIKYSTKEEMLLIEDDVNCNYRKNKAYNNV